MQQIGEESVLMKSCIYKDFVIIAHQDCSRNEFSGRTVGTSDIERGGDSEITRKNSNASDVQRRKTTSKNGKVN
jgi:hypothetical protein